MEEKREARRECWRCMLSRMSQQKSNHFITGAEKLPVLSLMFILCQPSLCDSYLPSGPVHWVQTQAKVAANLSQVLPLYEGRGA